MRVRIEQISNSRVVRPPKTFLPEAQVGDSIDLQIKPGHRPSRKTTGSRDGRMEAARRMRAYSKDHLVDPNVSTGFDQEDWKWE